MKVAIIGPESTGKTALAGQLAARFHAPWVPEYAREYVSSLHRPYTRDDVEAIARRQIEQEREYAGWPAERHVFFDTDLIVTKVWFAYCYRSVPPFVEERLATRFFDLYLLCAPDLPWQYDPVREHGDDRDFFFDWYRREVEALGTPCAIITGQGGERLRKAVEAIDNLVDN